MTFKTQKVFFRHTYCYLQHFMNKFKATVKCCVSENTGKEGKYWDTDRAGSNWGSKEEREKKPRPSGNDTDKQCNAIKTLSTWASFGMKLWETLLQWQGWERALGRFHTCGLVKKMDVLLSFDSSPFCFLTDLLQLKWQMTHSLDSFVDCHPSSSVLHGRSRENQN